MVCRKMPSRRFHEATSRRSAPRSPIGPTSGCWSRVRDGIARTRTHDAAGERAPVLIARSGGPSQEGGRLTDEAQSRGLRVHSFDTEQAFIIGLGDVTRAGADVVNLRFGVSPSLARTLYAASDGVLANSVSEPFGLVGLEAMAAGGVAFTGG